MKYWIFNQQQLQTALEAWCESQLDKGVNRASVLFMGRSVQQFLISDEAVKAKIVNEPSES